MKTKNKIKKEQIKTPRSQQTISEAFKKVIDKKEDLPVRNTVKEMWKELDMKVVRMKESEKKGLELEKQTEARKSTMITTNLKINEIKIKTKNENEKQQQKPNNNKNKQIEKTTTKTNLKLNKIDNNSEMKPELTKKAKPNSKLRVQGKQISDIETLRDFLAKKKLERAERGAITAEASHTARSYEIKTRDKPTNTGEPEPEPNQMKKGLEIAAKGTTALDVTDSIGQNKL